MSFKGRGAALKALFPIVGLLTVAFMLHGEGLSAAARAGKNGGQATLPLSALAVDEATVTVTVLQDPLESVKNILSMCQEGTLGGPGQEGADLGEDMRAFCKTVDQLTRGVGQPSHAMKPGSYLVTIPLKQPQGSMRSVTWRSVTLDDAITFLDLVQGGKLKAVNVYAFDPWSPNAFSGCTQCPIKDLVFQAKSIKQQQEILKQHLRK